MSIATDSETLFKRYPFMAKQMAGSLLVKALERIKELEANNDGLALAAESLYLDNAALMEVDDQ